jgi:hypothetical protein
MIRVVCSSIQNKEWRRLHICKTDGQRDGSSEKYQIDLVKQITKYPYIKTKLPRLNKRTLELKYVYCPMTKNKQNLINGLDWTEDFDGLQTIGTNKLLYNLKFITEGGGGQTRTLRCVSEFIETQLKFLKKNNTSNMYFINILDGDVSHFRKDCFTYLLTLSEYKGINKEYVFIGDMLEFQNWFNSRLI